MRAQQVEASAVVEPTIKVDGLDAEVKPVNEFEELTEDIAVGVASDQLTNRQRLALAVYSHIERGVGAKRRDSMFHL